MLTGESAPVPKIAGNPVVAGSLNGTGRLLVRVVRTGGETVLSRVVQAVEEAQARKAPIQRAADRVVRFFVPAILLIAAGTVLLGLHGGSLSPAALMAGISVLVIACPCALGLATPLAVLVGTTSAQARGILVRGGDVLEQAARVRCVLFDKTGTLTLGRPRLTDVVGIGIGPDDALRLAASLEASSEHAIGRAIADALPAARRLPVTGFRAHPGEGIEGKIDGVRYMMGTPELLERFGVAVDGEASRAYATLSADAADRGSPLRRFDAPRGPRHGGRPPAGGGRGRFPPAGLRNRRRDGDGGRPGRRRARGRGSRNRRHPRPRDAGGQARGGAPRAGTVRCPSSSSATASTTPPPSRRRTSGSRWDAERDWRSTAPARR